MTVDESDRPIVRLIFLDDGETFGVLDECAVVDVESAAVDDLESGIRLDELIRDGKATIVQTSLTQPQPLAAPGRVAVDPPGVKSWGTFRPVLKAPELDSTTALWASTGSALARRPGSAPPARGSGPEVDS